MIQGHNEYIKKTGAWNWNKSLHLTHFRSWDAYGRDSKQTDAHETAGTACKSSEHDATLKTDVILLLLHNAWILTQLNFVNILSPRQTFFATTGRVASTCRFMYPQHVPQCVATSRIRKKTKQSPEAFSLRLTFRCNQHSLSLLLT